MFEKILVVCVGNICRSPTGERLLRERLPGRQVSSAGVSALVDKPADKVASEVAQQHGLSLEGHSARQLTRELCQDADLILVMEKGHISAVTAIDPGARGKTMLFGHWQGESEVPDPYRLSREAYEHVYQLLVRSADGWAKKTVTTSAASGGVWVVSDYKNGLCLMTTSSVSSRQSSAAVENDEIDLGRLLGYLIDGRWWIVTITALFMVLGVAYALLATPVFKANALLQVEKKASGAALLGDMADVLGGEQPDAAAEIELLTSRMVLGRTVQELHLDTVVTPNFFPLVGRGLSRLMGHPYPKMAVSRFEVAPELLGTPLTLTVDADKHFTLEVEGRVLEGQVGKLLEKEDVTLLLSDVAADEGAGLHAGQTTSSGCDCRVAARSSGQ